jgi:hypothetical protein
MKRLLFLATLLGFTSWSFAQNYEMTVTTKGGVQYTVPAEDVISVEFEQAAETLGPIPAGIDLSLVFAMSTTQEVLSTYNHVNILLSEGDYYLTSDIEVPTNVRFGIKAQGAGANIKMGDATLIVGNAFTLENLHLDASQSTKPLVTLSSTPNEDLKGATGSGNYYNIIKPFVIRNCDVKGLSNVIISDKGTSYCLGVVLVDNCLFELCSENVSGMALVDMRSGGINDLTISNSTIYQKGPGDVKYLIQYNNSYRCDRGGYERNSVNILNNTFYNVCFSGQFANYSGLAGRNTSDWQMKKNIFVNVSNGETARRFLGSRNNQATAQFDHNCYWYNGADENYEGYDTSGNVISGDPQFVNAEEGNFTPTSEEHVGNKIGDPRWYAE